jgi:HPr kinase/phosphorylase
MDMQKKTIVHGTAVAIKDKGAVLLRGPSGAGKSDVAFRLIGQGALLIGDDQVALERRQDNKIMADHVPAIKGLLEVRALGLVKYPVAPQQPLRLIIDLIPREAVVRMPEWETEDILGVAVPRLQLHGFDASTPLKIIQAIELVHKPDLLVR